MTTIQSSDLDFDAIKSALKTHLKRGTDFTDYDFEASGLSNILDVLAYNTHLNGLIANVGLNESFLTSAQLRSSVVSHAETLGYYPRSKTASSIKLNLTVASSDTTTGTITLPAYTEFTTSVDDVSYTFRNTEEFTASNDGSGNFTFKTTDGSSDIVVKEGALKTKTYLVGDETDNQVYIIPDENIDTETIAVTVFPTAASTSGTTYTDIQNAVRINATSTVFIVREVPNGYFELTFSEGNVLGKAPEAGNKIEVKYLQTKGKDANNATTFTTTKEYTLTSGDHGITITLPSGTTKSGGGDDKETIGSIKANAPIAFATQQRLVTAEDYKALILQRFSSTVKDVTAWGGNDNVPKNYGNVYVSLNFKDNIDAATQTSTKDNIKNTLSENLGIMSIDTIFSDPIHTFLELTTTFNFDPDLTGDTIEATQTRVQAAINTFINDNLNTFDAVFRRSQLLTTIDALGPAVLNTSIDPKVQQRFTPTLNFLQNLDVNFPVALQAPDDVTHIVQTGTFNDQNGEQSFIRNKLESTTLEMVNNVTGNISKDNVGSYNPSTGVVSFVGIEISSFTGDDIKISAIPNDKSTIKPLRNYILKVDTDKSSSTGIIDYQNTATTLT